VVDFLVSRHVPQFESLNAFSCILLSARKNKPCEGLADNVVVDAIKLVLLNHSNISIAKIVVNKIEREK